MSIGRPRVVFGIGPEIRLEGRCPLLAHPPKHRGRPPSLLENVFAVHVGIRQVPSDDPARLNGPIDKLQRPGRPDHHARPLSLRSRQVAHRNVGQLVHVVKAERTSCTLIERRQADHIERIAVVIGVLEDPPVAHPDPHTPVVGTAAAIMDDLRRIRRPQLTQNVRRSPGIEVYPAEEPDDQRHTRRNGRIQPLELPEPEHVTRETDKGTRALDGAQGLVRGHKGVVGAR